MFSTPMYFLRVHPSVSVNPLKLLSTYSCPLATTSLLTSSNPEALINVSSGTLFLCTNIFGVTYCGIIVYLEDVIELALPAGL